MAEETKPHIYGAYGFVIGCMLLPGYRDLAWFFDWDGAKTGSSTAGSIYIYNNLYTNYTLIPGGIGYLMGRGLAGDEKT